MATMTESDQRIQAENLRGNGGVRGREGFGQSRVMGLNAERVARGLGWFSIGLGAAELLAPGAIARLVGGRNHRALIRSYGMREIAAGVGLLAAARPGPWLWARAAGDALDLASLGKVLGSPKASKARAAFGIASVAGVTVLDIMTARELSPPLAETLRAGSRAEASIIVNRSPEECYGFWRKLENHPIFMNYLKSVRETGSGRSHWVASAAGRDIEWDSEIETDIPNQRITWRSLPDSSVRNTGSVEFDRAPGGRGTIVRVQIDFGNLLHVVGAAAATLIGKHPEQILKKTLRRFKQVLETGEVITTEGQSSGRRSGSTWLDQIAR
jgi:uncharacterized membrane protein